MRINLIWLAVLLLSAANYGRGDDLTLNELEYFEARGVNVLPYNNRFSGGFNDEKNAGIELIQHGVRSAQGGAVRLSNTPEQWDLVPSITARSVDRESHVVETTLRYDDYDFDSRVVVTAKGSAVEIAVYLDNPLPPELEGDAGFNLEFLPSQYWSKTYVIDGRVNRLPRYVVGRTVTRPNSEKPRQFKGYRTYDDRGTDRFIDVLPLETGRRLVLAPDDPLRMVTITSDEGDLMLLDGRVLAQNGWYVVRTLLPAGRTGKVVSWTVEPHGVPGWVREPNVGFSQVGYLPTQPKVSVIELDKNDTPLMQASVHRIDEQGDTTEVFRGDVVPWGDYFKYHYARFDFSAVEEPGVYYLQYGDTKTNNFIINEDVYEGITDATSDVWVPIHMNHMFVREGYRVWHGEPFKEGYRQAPPNTDHFDMHRQGPTTGTPYEALELIPGLNVGGFFDAGDFDIETGSNIRVVQSLVQAWESFRPLRDQTFVNQEQRYVELHRPDGVPDILQYIEHGTLQLVTQAETIGFMTQTLSNSVLYNYHHLGDAGSLTDGLPYNKDLGPYEVASDGQSSGVKDDLWAFTNRDPGRDLRAAATLAAASRALKEHNAELASRALKQSKKLLQEATVLLADQPENTRSQRRARVGDVSTNLQLFISTGQQRYADNYQRLLWPLLERDARFVIATALEGVPHMDAAFKERLRPYVVQHREYVEGLEEDNPYGVPITLTNWAGSGAVVSFGTTVTLAHTHFPEIIEADHALKATDWLFGNHPYHNYSLVAAVGAARPKEVFYGNNRADFSFIPGNVAPGLLFRKPDHFENFDDWPFLWGQNEGTIAGNTQYFYFGMAIKKMLGQ